MEVRRTAVVLGKGPLSVVAITVLEESGYEIIGVVPAPSQIPTVSLSDFAVERGIAVYKSLGHLLDAASAANHSLAISVSYDRVITPEEIHRFELILNLHNSPLPRYRGMRPINWALKNGEAEHGVTLHEIAPEVDAGAIVASIRFPIDPTHDEVEDVYSRCLIFGEALIRSCLPIAHELPRMAQDHSKATYFDRSSVSLLDERSTLRRPSA